MQNTQSGIDTQKGPADWFTGDVYIDAVAAPAGSSTFAAAAVHFTPGERAAWHSHPHGQTIFVTEGVGPSSRGNPLARSRSSSGALRGIAVIADQYRSTQIGVTRDFHPAQSRSNAAGSNYRQVHGS